MLYPGRVKVGEGDMAPDFTLPDQDGNDVRLYDLLERGPVVLFFYPKNNTWVCTAEACAFRDSHEVFADAGAQVVGVSRDSIGSHGRFRDKHSLPYKLLSDRERVAHKLYGVRAGPEIPVIGWGANDRITWVIDRDGTVKFVHAGVLESHGHVNKALKVVQKLVP